MKTIRNTITIDNLATIAALNNRIAMLEDHITENLEKHIAALEKGILERDAALGNPPTDLTSFYR